MSAKKQATNSQRAQELRRFFAPFDPPLSPAADERVKEINASLLDDGALDSYAEAVLWRLNAKRAMVSLVDRQTQYFLAGTVRDGDMPEVDRLWYGCSTVPTRGGLCENTLALSRDEEDDACFVVSDLSQDIRFGHLPVVDGSIAKLRFYAGAPITTNRGVNIGSFFVFDTEPRPDGLTQQHRKFLCKSASHVMRHLEIKREAAERRRLALMGAGIARFLEANTLAIYGPSRSDESGSEESQEVRLEAEERKINVPKQLSRALERATEILRDSLELDVGGVILLDTAAGTTEAYLENTVTEQEIDSIVGNPPGRSQSSRPGGGGPLDPRPELNLQPGTQQFERSRSYEGRNQEARVLASAVGEHFDQVQAPRSLDQKALQSLVKSYPKGNLWYIDEEGFFPSLDQVDEFDLALLPESYLGRPRSKSTTTFKRQRAEAKLLAQTFAGARQILFLPLWDAALRRWHSGCLVWNQSPVPVFTGGSEIAYLSAFTNSVMAEVSRLEAVAADRMKADFISSISHEFRSPMHAILASAEFLRETDYTEEQAELINTIQTSGYTLLVLQHCRCSLYSEKLSDIQDTINHVLDYSKINSFKKEPKRESGSDQVGLKNELFAVTNLALLTEEIISGMIAAKHFQNNSAVSGEGLISPSFSASRAPKPSLYKSDDHVNVILDFSERDWKFVTQPGALRHIVMNIFGNAQKYTDSGFIRVSLRLEGPKTSPQNALEPKYRTSSVVTLTIEDSGRGMSAEFMNKSLYTPFAQEDTFASGVGLGLSIVRSIVDQLNGTIRIWSEVGKGTKVELRLPFNNVSPHQNQCHNINSQDPASNCAQAEQCMDAVRKLASGKVVALRRRDYTKEEYIGREGSTLDIVEQYLSRWMGFVVTTFCDSIGPQTDLIIADEGDTWDSWPDVGATPIFLICHSRSSIRARKHQRHSKISTFIPGPVGPYKLAEFILSNFLRYKELGASGGAKTRASPDPGKTVDEIIELVAKSNLNDAIEEPSTTHPLRKPSVKAAKRPSSSSGQGPLEDHQGHKAPPILLAPVSSQGRTTRPEKLTPKGRPLHILIVDDNEINLQLLHRYLAKRKNDTIDMTRDGVEAVFAFKSRDASQSPLYDLIFMDLSMPVMDGFEATRLIRQYEATVVQTRRGGNHQRVHIVALTGLAAQRDRDEAVNCGFDDYMTKPVSFQKIGKLLTERSAVDGNEV